MNQKSKCNYIAIIIKKKSFSLLKGKKGTILPLSIPLICHGRMGAGVNI